MGKQSALDGMPALPTPVTVSGNLLYQGSLEVDDEVMLEVRVAVRKAGLAHTSDGSPKPYATTQIVEVVTKDWSKATPAQAKISSDK